MTRQQLEAIVDTREVVTIIDHFDHVFGTGYVMHLFNDEAQIYMLDGEESYIRTLITVPFKHVVKLQD